MPFRSFAFPASIVFATIYIVLSLWIGLRNIGDANELESQLTAAREYRQAIDRYHEALLASATRAWKFRADGNDADRTLALERLEQARQALLDLESADQRVRFGLDNWLDPSKAQVGLDAVRLIASETDSASKNRVEVASSRLQEIRQQALAVIRELDNRIDRWQPELTSGRKLIRSLLIYGQLVMLGLLGLIYVSRRAEDELRNKAEREQRRFAMMLSEIPEPIYVEDSDGRIVFWNAGAEKLYGKSAAKMVGKIADEVFEMNPVSPSHSSQHSDDYRTAQRWKGEMRAAGACGRTLHIERRKTKIMEGAQVAGVVVLDLDLGERKRSQIVNRRRQRLEALGTLASGIAHDLNNLLTPILMSSKMLARRDAKVDRDGLIDTIEQAASRGAGLIEQLLLFARGGESQHTTLDLASVLQDTAKILQRTLSKDIKLELTINDSLPPVHGDETEISQVVMNLAINARDAMPNGGRLGILAEVVHLEKESYFAFTTLGEGSYVRVAVSDNGRGISPEQRDRIFDPFFSTKERGQGTGLGLSTTLGIVKSHQGAMDVKSVVGEGTTIAVLLPTQKPTVS